MGNLVRLEDQRRRKAAKMAFARWPQRVGYKPSPGEKMTDLPDEALGVLAELDSEGTLALYDLALGVRGWGAGERFPFLDPGPKMEALDAFLFLADQVRFEMMRRLGWVKGLPAEEYPLVDLAADHKRIIAQFQPSVPGLSPDHPKYQSLQKRLGLEPAAVIRSLIPEALELFRRRVAERPEP